MIKEEIKRDFKKAIEKTTGTKIKEVYLECPGNPEYGDYTSNFALKKLNEVRSSKLKVKNPGQLAQKIIENFPKRDYLS